MLNQRCPVPFSFKRTDTHSREHKYRVFYLELLFYFFKPYINHELFSQLINRIIKILSVMKYPIQMCDTYI